jgi:ABC-type glycerol-3-phosphate transport system substrate-binding protein
MLHYSSIRATILLLPVLWFSCTESVRDASTLTYWSASNPEEKPFAQTSIDQWNNGHPDHQIKFQPVSEGSSSEEIMVLLYPFIWMVSTSANSEGVGC